MIQIWEDAPIHATDGQHFYRIASQTVISDRFLPGIESLSQLPHQLESICPGRDPGPLAEGTLTYCKSGWLAGDWRQVTASHRESTYRVAIDRVGRFHILNGGRCIRYQRMSISPRHWVEALFGPPMTLALALHNTWVLHASAASCKERVVAFLGASGAGKSTLAGHLITDAGWNQIADDALPVEIDGDGLWVSPHFPQFKTESRLDAGAPMPAHLPLHAIYLLAPPTSEIEIRPITRADALLALLRHTVAARLFGRPLLTAHFEAMQQIARTVPAYLLAYPRDRSQLPAVATTLGAHLHMLA